jgi:hypothetical protein
MHVCLDRKGRVVAVFVHFSDAVQFREDNKSHSIELKDEPGLTQDRLAVFIDPSKQR